MVSAFHNEQAVTLEGEPYRLVLDFAAIDAAESRLAPLGFDRIVGQLMDGSAPLATQTKVVWALLRAHHPEITIDQAATLVVGRSNEALGAAIGQLILAAFPLKEAGQEGTAHPRTRGGASRSSSSNGPQPGSTRPSSGARRRAPSSPS